jgi:hypothetical protein
MDYVLARPERTSSRVQARRTFPAGEPVGGLHASDHFAVVAGLMARAERPGHDRVAPPTSAIM